MILHPVVLALLAGSALSALALVHAAFWAARILAAWDPASGSEAQLDLERRTHLISTVLTVVMGFQTLAAFLLVFTAEDLSGRLAGAMCAAGTFNANAYGVPALALKTATCLLAGLWLVLNHADSRAHDHPLLRPKYALLLLLAPLAVAGDAAQVAFLAGLKAEVITSCCGSLFGAEAGGLVNGFAALPHRPLAAVLAALALATFAAGLAARRRDRGYGPFSVLSVALSLAAGAALVSFVAVYIYELPGHHCPFCLLKAEYRFVGYLFYAALAVGGITGAGAGLLAPFRARPSLAAVLPGLQRSLATTALACHALYLLAAAVAVWGTAFRLD